MKRTFLATVTAPTVGEKQYIIEATGWHVVARNAVKNFRKDFTGKIFTEVSVTVSRAKVEQKNEETPKEIETPEKFYAK